MTTGLPHHTKLDTWTFWISNVLMFIMIGITITATIYVFKHSEFYWVRMMFILCILQNVATLYLSFGDYFEESYFSATNTYAVAWVNGTSVFFFFFITILIYWLFGFKYWIISREVPRFLEGSSGMAVSEQKYRNINIIVITVFALVCGYASDVRGRVSIAFV